MVIRRPNSSLSESHRSLRPRNLNPSCLSTVAGELRVHNGSIYKTLQLLCEMAKFLVDGAGIMCPSGRLIHA